MRSAGSIGVAQSSPTLDQDGGSICKQQEDEQVKSSRRSHTAYVGSLSRVMRVAWVQRKGAKAVLGTTWRERASGQGLALQLLTWARSFLNSRAEKGRSLESNSDAMHATPLLAIMDGHLW